MSELPLLRPHPRTSMVGKSAQRDADHGNTDLPGVIAFLLIGLLLALNIMLRFPEIGALVTQYNQF
jgi:hypothetical protein